MKIDDYHDHFLCPENKKELEELTGWVTFYNGKKDKKWLAMYRDIKKCIEMFGYGNISLYHNEYMKYGDGIEEIQNGFWVNLRDANYNDEGYLEFDNASIMIENGFMYIRNTYGKEEPKKNVTNKIKNKEKDKIKPLTKKKTANRTTKKS